MDDGPIALKNRSIFLVNSRTDPHPRVRLHAIVASSYVPKVEALEVPAAAAKMPIDKFIDYALKQTVYSLKPVWLTAEALGQITIAADEDLINLMLRAGEAQMAVGAVREILNNSNNYAQKISVGRALIENGKAHDFATILSINDEALRSDLLEGIVQAVRNRNLAPHDSATQALLPLVRQNNPDAIRLAGLWRIDQTRPAIVTLAQNTKSKAIERIAAIEALGNWKDADSKTLLLTIARDPNPALQTAAICALANIDLAVAAEIAANSKLPADHWEQIFTTFLQRAGGAAALAKAFGSSPPGAEVVEKGMRIMNDTGRRDEALARVLNPTDAPKLTSADVPQLVEEVRKRGSAERGQQIYQRAELGCVSCHAVKGVGGTTGPDLGALGTAQPISFIVGAILEPQKEVKEGYVASSITTKDGDEYQGYITAEDSAEVRIRETLANQVITIPKAQIQQRRQTGSLMPAGLVDPLSREEFVDLVKYLSELGE